MGKSKEQFLALRELENLTYDYTFTKKEAKSQGVKTAKDIIERAEKDPFEVLSNVVRLKEFINAFETEFKKADAFEQIDKNYNKNGVEFSTRNSGDRLDYEKDVVYKDLKKQLDDRTALLKLAYKSKDVIYDSDGADVPKVPIKTHGKNSLVITF